MPSFTSSFVRPGVYVNQTTAISAPALPTSFSAAFIGHGTDRFTITQKAITSDGSATQVLDSARNVVSILSVSYKNQTVSSANYGFINNGAVPFGSASITWSSGTPTASSIYYVSYVAYKNPSSDFVPQNFTDFSDFLSFYGAPVASTAAILSGMYVKNNMTLAAYIGSLHGMGEFYGQQLNAFDESTTGVVATLGTSISAAIPATATTAGDTLILAINGESTQTITLATSASGAAVAADIQAKVRALTAKDSALQAAYDRFTCAYTTVYTLTSGMAGSNSAVVVSAGTAAVALKLGLGNAGSEAAGSGATYLNLTQEAGLLTSVTQALAHLLLVKAWAIVPCFPMVSGDINTSIISVVAAHISSARSVVENKWRVALLGAEKNSDAGASPQTKYITTQVVLGNRALCYMAPSTAEFTYGGVDFTLDGWSLASAIAGIVSNPAYDAGEPISGKDLVGFKRIADPFNGTQKSQLGAAGVFMIDSEYGTPAVLMDLTTDQSSNVNSQLKFTRSGDYVSSSLSSILHKLYVNSRNIGPTTLSSIAGSTKMILQQLATLHIINDFSGLSVTKDGIDSRQVDIVVAVQLVPDVSWIYVQLSLQL